jgi:hypothetical protein
MSQQLQTDGIKAFASSFDDVVATIGEKRGQILTTTS